MVEISKNEKLKRRVLSCPLDLTLEEAHRYLLMHGYQFARQKGSHCVYRKPGSNIIVTIQGPILREYQVKQIIAATSDDQKEEGL